MSSTFSDQEASLASSAMPRDFTAVYWQGTSVLDAQDRLAIPQRACYLLQACPLSARGATSPPRTIRSRRGSRILGRKTGRADKSALNNSDRSDDSSVRRLVSFVMDQANKLKRSLGSLLQLDGGGQE